MPLSTPQLTCAWRPNNARRARPPKAIGCQVARPVNLLLSKKSETSNVPQLRSPSLGHPRTASVRARRHDWSSSPHLICIALCGPSGAWPAVRIDLDSHAASRFDDVDIRPMPVRCLHTRQQSPRAASSHRDVAPPVDADHRIVDRCRSVPIPTQCRWPKAVTRTGTAAPAPCGRSRGCGVTNGPPGATRPGMPRPPAAASRWTRRTGSAPGSTPAGGGRP